MSAYGPGEEFLRSFEAKCRAVSATRRKALEEVAAALDVDADPLPQHAEGKLATCAAITWPGPPVQRNPLFGNPPASEHFSARAASSQGCVQPRCEHGWAEDKLASASSSSGRVADISAEQRQGRFPPPPCHAATFARRIDAAGAAAAADACFSDPVDVVGTSAHRSPIGSARCPPSSRPPVTVADRGSSRGHGDAPFRVPSIRKVLQDLAGVGDAGAHSSPVEQVLARRKRRRRANFGVSSALLLPACTEEAPLPPMPDPLPLVTRADDEHSATVRDLGDELDSLDLSHISCDSSGSWNSKAVSGFRREPEGAIERLAPFDGAADIPQVLNPDQVPGSRTDHELHRSGNGDRNGFAVSTPTRSDHREGITSLELREGRLRQIAVDATSCGGLDCVGGGERCTPARAKHGNLGAFEGCRGDNIDGDVDRFRTQVPLTEGNGKPSAAAGLLSFDFDQDVPPSPLPLPPVPLSPTARGDTSSVRRRPPSRILSVSGTTLLPQSLDDSGAWGAPDSKQHNLCTEKASATKSTPRTARNEASGEEEVLSPPEEPLSENRAWGSTAGVRADGGIDEGVIAQTPQTQRASSPQPRLGDRVEPPETVLLQEIAAPAGDYVPPKVQRQRGASISSPKSPNSAKPSSSGRCKTDPTSSLSAQTTSAAQYFGRETGTQAKALHGKTQNGIDVAVSLSSYTRGPHEASLKQAQLSKTVAVLALQPWLRCAVLRREGTPGPERGATQRTRELNKPNKSGQLQPAKSSTSTARHHPRKSHMEGVAHAHGGASPSESNPIGLEEAVSLVPNGGHLVRDGVPPYWEDDPIRDGSHALPRNGLVITSADRRSFGKAPFYSPPAFARNDGLSHERPMKKPGSGAENSADQRGRRDSCRDDGITQPPGLAVRDKTVGADTKQAPKMPSSTILISGPNASPPVAASLSPGLSSPVLPRLKRDDRLQRSEQPSERGKGTIAPKGDPTSARRDCNSARDTGHHPLSPYVYHGVRVARDAPCYSVVALGRRLGPADVRLRVGDGYGLTVQEACLRPSSSQGGGGRAPCSFRVAFVVANDRESCHRGSVMSTAAEIPVIKSAPHYRQQEDRPSMLLARAFARQGNMNLGEDVGGNPLLDAWGVGNPLLTRPTCKISGTSNGGGAPYG